MTRKRTAVLLALALLILAAPVSAQEALPEPFTGYYLESAYMRSVPKLEDAALRIIPPYTAVLLTPVNEKYAAVSYDGAQGYVYYLNAQRMPKETPVEPYIAYSEGSKFLLDTPLAGAKQVAVIAPETPVTVFRQTGGFDRVLTPQGEGYIRDADMKTLPGDTAIVPVEIFSNDQVQAHELPLAHSAVVETLSARQVYLSAARCRGWYKVSWGTREGYVLCSAVSVFSADTRALRVGLTADAPLYTHPDAEFSAPQDARPAAGLLFFDGENNGFYHIADTEYYVEAALTKTWAVESIATSELYPESDVPLALRPSPDGALSGVSLRAGALYQANYAVGDYYLLMADGVWGFVPKSAVSRLLAGENMNRTAAVACADTAFYSLSGVRGTLPAGRTVFLTRLADSFYLAETEGQTGFVMARDVRLLGADAPVTQYSLTAPFDIPLMDVPDSALSKSVGVIKAGERVSVSAFNRCYLLVSGAGLTGYCAQDGLLCAETEGMPQTEDAPRYELVLDKSTRMIYAFVLDENGERSETIAASANVAVGKRTTPTPSGTFTLGMKERWHRFARSFTPYTTAYTTGRYIHGLPCLKKAESTVIDDMAHNAGQAVTGGCLRSPFAFARWVYMNCPSYQTKLTVVNGGLLLPGEAEAPISNAPGAQENDEATPDEGGEPEDDDPEAPQGADG